MKKRVEDVMVEFIKKQADYDDIYTLLELGMEQTPRICEAIVEKDPIFIAYIESQTPELCINSLRNCHDDCIEYVFSKIKVRTLEVCMEAVKRESSLVFFVEDPSDELWLTAISMEPDIFSDIRYPSYNLCLEAVRRNPEVLKYIEIPEWRKEIKRELKPGIQELIEQGKNQKGKKKSMEQHVLYKKDGKQFQRK